MGFASFGVLACVGGRVGGPRERRAASLPLSDTNGAIPIRRANPKSEIRSPKSQIGFTLIELLVVIAILAVLAAILFPVFARAREQARKATCGSNLQQISRAFDMYAADYGYLPPFCAKLDGGYPNVPQTDGSLLVDAPQPYLRNRQVFFCPSDSFAGKYTALYQPDVINHANTSYCFNWWSYDRWVRTGHPAPLDEPLDPGLFAGEPDSPVNGATLSTAWLAHDALWHTELFSATPINPHVGGAMQVWMDGHCRFLRNGEWR